MCDRSGRRHSTTIIFSVMMREICNKFNDFCCLCLVSGRHSLNNFFANEV